jgi:hypothetical protein
VRVFLEHSYLQTDLTADDIAEIGAEPEKLDPMWIEPRPSPNFRTNRDIRNESAPVGGQDRAEIQHLGEAQPTTVAGVFGGQDRAEIQHLGDAEPATVAAVFGDRAETGLGPIGGQERAAIQHVGAQPQPPTNLEPSSGGIDLEIVLLTGTLALITVLMTAGAFLWFRRHTVRPA